MKQVFISYKSEEKRQAKEILEYLESRGIQCWMAPRNIPIGSNYAAQIPKAIRECPAFLLMLSEKAQRSQWIAKELSLAIGGNKEILPLMLEACSLTDEYSYYLTNVQIYPLYENREEVLEEMEERIRQILNQPDPEQETPKAPVPVKPYDGNEPYIFINYASKDRERVEPIIRLLQEKGFRVWADTGISLGCDWAECIAQKLNECGCVISMVSENYVQSHMCRRELDYALMQKKPTLTVHMDEMDLPLGMRMQISGMQALFRYRHSNDAEFVEVLAKMPVLKECR